MLVFRSRNGLYLETVFFRFQQAERKDVASGVTGADVIVRRRADHFGVDTAVAGGEVDVRVRPIEVRHRFRHDRELPQALYGRVQQPEQRPDRRARLVMYTHPVVTREKKCGGQTRQATHTSRSGGGRLICFFRFLFFLARLIGLTVDNRSVVHSMHVKRRFVAQTR